MEIREIFRDFVRMGNASVGRMRNAIDRFSGGGAGATLPNAIVLLGKFCNIFLTFGKKSVLKFL